ncbi:MAG TPA: hypothetical protein PKC89_13395 [Pyrinomonadaceae bacterium]|nr:hypothetical protein [Pyrinomonadaceae bacterium]
MEPAKQATSASAVGGEAASIRDFFYPFGRASPTALPKGKPNSATP